MKIPKRILAVILAMVLALGLAMPTMAAVNWNEFNFNKHPESMTIENGDSFMLSVEVNVPDGVVVEYQLYYRSYLSETGLIENATSPELHLERDDPFYPGSKELGDYWVEYRCQITAYEKDNDGNIISPHKLDSNYARVTRTRTFGEKLYDITLKPFETAIGYVAASLALSWGIALPLAPLLFLGALIYGFFKEFIGLF